MALENIDHTKTKARSPQTNGICRRVHKTRFQEFSQIAFRTKLYESIEQLQTQFDEGIKSYDEERPHCGRFCFGKTLRQTSDDSKELAEQKMLDQFLQPSA